MPYRVGLPGWKLVARAGIPTSLRVDVMKDAEAGVFVATSPDLPGLVAEAATLEDLVAEIKAGVIDLLSDYLHPPAKPPVTNFRINGGHCAA